MEEKGKDDAKAESDSNFYEENNEKQYGDEVQFKKVNEETEEKEKENKIEK